MMPSIRGHHYAHPSPSYAHAPRVATHRLPDPAAAAAGTAAGGGTEEEPPPIHTASEVAAWKVALEEGTVAVVDDIVVVDVAVDVVAVAVAVAVAVGNKDPFLLFYFLYILLPLFSPPPFPLFLLLL